jgi:hypothetical protein
MGDLTKFWLPRMTLVTIFEIIPDYLRLQRQF